MPEQPPAHDETVRMRADGPDSRPPVEASRPAPAVGDTPEPQDSFVADGDTPGPQDSFVADGGETHDTRPVPRDWPGTATETGTGGAAATQDDKGDDGRPPADDAAAVGFVWWRRRSVLVPAGALVLLAAVYGGDLLLSSGSMPRSTVVAGVDIGGLSRTAAEKTLDAELSERVAADRRIVADDVEGAFSPTRAGFRLDAAATVDAADDQPLNPWTRITSLFADREIDAVVGIDESAVVDELGSFSAQLETFAEQVDRAPADATIAIEGTTPGVVEPADGRTLDRAGAQRTITEALTGEEDPARPLELPVDVDPVAVDAPEAERVLSETVEPALAAPIAVTGGSGGPTAEVSVSALAASLTFTPTEKGELEVGLDPAALQRALDDELAVFGTPARNATFEVAGGSVRVVPSVDGTGIDPTHLVDQLLPVLADPAPRSVSAEPGPVPAELTTQEAEALGIREEISSFTTIIGNAASGENIRLVAAEVDGALVLPGETFSLNTYTGPRGTAQGYVPAAVISGGKLSTAVGGGISQFATTMFNAVFFAGLEDVQHKPHSFYISRYPAGREATVYEGLIDLQWRNDGDTGVYVDTAWTPGSLTVTFYGTKRYAVDSISSERRNPREPAVVDKVDDGNCTRQSGVPGFDITVTRVFKDLSTGGVIRREDFQTRYNAEATINCVPPAGLPPGPPDPPAVPAGTTPASPPAPGGRRPGGRRMP